MSDHVIGVQMCLSRETIKHRIERMRRASMREIASRLQSSRVMWCSSLVGDGVSGSSCGGELVHLL
jgi:hypothetical protein